MKKAECIKRYGEDAYERKLAKNREKWSKAGYIKQYGEEAWLKRLEKRRESRKQDKEVYERELEKNREWQRKNPEKTKAIEHKKNRKGGERYKQKLEYNTTGLQGARHRIRNHHRRQWKSYKDIIAPDSVIHHEWIDKTAGYTGVALVEKDQHQHGYIDVIQILDGKITLLTEEEINKRGGKTNEKEN